MNCQKVSNLLSAFLDRELCYEDDRKIRQHLAFCDSCNAEYEEIKAAKDLIGSLPSREMPAGFWLELHERLQAEARRAGSGDVGLRPASAGRRNGGALGANHRRRLPRINWPFNLRPYKLVPAGVLVMVALAVPFLTSSLEPAPEIVRINSFLNEHNLHAAEQALTDEGPLTYRLTREEVTAPVLPDVGWQSAASVLGYAHANTFADPSIHSSHRYASIQSLPAVWRQP
ncbi:MAG: anti-sigma factor family protein [Syntrophothermus sp.]